MRKLRPFALVGAGQVRNSCLNRLPAVTQHLGPVKAQTFRLASRIANTLRAGYPVRRYEDLDDCRLIIVCVPASLIKQVLSDMAAADCSWSGKAVLIYNSFLADGELEVLSARGAALGSLVAIESADNDRFLVEGDRLAVRAAKRLLDTGGARALEIRRSSQVLYAASSTFGSCLFVPLVDASVACLRQAGLTRGQAGLIVEKTIQKSLRSYLKGGRRAWKGPLALRNRDAVLRQLEVLREIDPLLATYFAECARQSLKLFGKSANWLETAIAAQTKTSDSGV
jgi:predicted short-subunit dehydrogenase-like oxidoreductase (DUF2520 family)